MSPHEDVGPRLARLLGGARTDVVLVAPFVKNEAFLRVLADVVPEVRLICITRWRPEEIQGGVSDLDVWLTICARPNSSLRLCDSLHAKYFRADDRCLLGSANLTAKALGWSVTPNLELLMESEVSQLADFEALVLKHSLPVTQQVYERMKALILSLGAPPTCAEVVEPGGAPPLWLPHTRTPSDLYLLYSGQAELLTLVGKEAVEADLRFLCIIPGLDVAQFNCYVGVVLLQTPLVAQVDKLLSEPTRFGAVRDEIREYFPGESLEGANYKWQTLMRWLMHFLPERYERVASRHSEVLRRRHLIDVS